MRLHCALYRTRPSRVLVRLVCQQHGHCKCEAARDGLQPCCRQSVACCSLLSWHVIPLPQLSTRRVQACGKPLLLHGRLVDGVEALARMLHPDQVSRRVPDGTACKLALSGGQRCRQSALPGLFHPYN